MEEISELLITVATVGAFFVGLLLGRWERKYERKFEYERGFLDGLWHAFVEQVKRDINAGTVGQNNGSDSPNKD